MEYKDMTSEEGENFFGTKTWKLMMKELVGNTCSVNKEGLIVESAYNIEKAHKHVVYGKKYLMD